MSKTSIETMRFALSGPAMGSRWSATIFAPASVSADALAATLAQAVEAVEQEMSNWRADSDLSRLNAAPVGVWTAIPRDLAQVLATALRIGRLTDGAFDIGVGARVAEWGFGPYAATTPGGPSSATRLASEALQLDVARARKSAETSLDLSGIAKGFGVDAMARALDALGLNSYLVGIDGELRAKGVKPDGAPFAVALERPEVGARGAMGAIALQDAAVATSGDYRSLRQAGGARWSHTIDPRTGRPVDHALAATTVIAPNCMEADAFATGLMTLGPDEGPATARRLGLDALFTLRHADGYETRGVGLFADAA
jgi:thiamine biosynthesis lipoprotein